MKSIVIYNDREERMAEIFLDESSISIKAYKSSMQKYFEEILEVILKRLPTNRKEAFELIPKVTSNYSRLIFGNIQT